jgi:hypothetical protein
MPRNAAYVVVALASGCVFDAAYKSGQTTCTDGACPSGLVCSAMQICVTPGQGSSDAGMTIDAMRDAGVTHALTCADPGELTNGVSVMGSTQGRANTVEPMCGGSVMTGADAIYTIAIGAAQSLDVTLTGSNDLAAYVLATCTASPCLGDAYTTPIVAPLVVNAGSAGTYYVVVDSALAAGSGSYTLSVTVD